MIRPFTLSRTHQILIISIVFLLVNGLNFHKYGIKIVNDSPRYIEYATKLHKGFYFDPHNFWYIGYASYIYVFQLFDSNFLTIIISQYLLQLVAVIALYYTSFNIWKNELSAFITSCFFVLFIDIALWNSYILAESVFASSTCITLYCFSLLYRGSRSTLLYVLTGTLLLFTILIKPTGAALLGASLLVFSIDPVKRIKGYYPRAIIGILIGLIFLVAVNRMLRTYGIMENYQKGEIIYAITTLPERPEYTLMVITPPENLYIPDPDLPPILKVIIFFYHHPIYWTQLFLAKLFFFVAHVRPYWSFWHNLYSVSSLILAYFLFTLAITSNKQHHKPVIFALAYVALHILSVCITSEDWDGRFLIPVLPVIFLFSGNGLSKLSQLSNAIKS